MVRGCSFRSAERRWSRKSCFEIFDCYSRLPYEAGFGDEREARGEERASAVVGRGGILKNRLHGESMRVPVKMALVVE